MSVIFINKSNEKKYYNYKKDLQHVFDKTVQYFDLANDTSVSCILVDEPSMIDYNYTYRNKNQTTDVLTFVDEVEKDYLGDVLINVKAVSQQAKDYDHSIKREICFLFVHGLLHTLGFDHHQQEEEAIMIAHQKEILKDVSKRSYRKSNP